MATSRGEGSPFRSAPGHLDTAESRARLGDASRFSPGSLVRRAISVLTRRGKATNRRRFLRDRGGEGNRAGRVVFIVSPEEAELHEHLKKSADERVVELIVERRRGERRQANLSTLADRRSGERRRHHEIRARRFVLVAKSGKVIWRAP